MENNINREISKYIIDDFFKKKIIILTGARQVGKTTLINSILSKLDNKKILRLNADNYLDRTKLEVSEFVKIDSIIGNNDIIFIDEAQKVKDIGNTLKLLVDNYQEKKQIIATRSSSINLLSNTEEPLTGRKYVYELFGLSLREIIPSLNPLEIEKALPNILVYGSYPEIYLSNDLDKQRLLFEITNSYLYKDILELEGVKNSANIQKLLSAIALQLGSEISITELSTLVGLDQKTINKYIDLLEKNYVIFRLPPYSNNQRKTLSKMNKIYFYDLGLRNALINNFNPIELRSDVGALWENFLIIERIKLNNYRRIYNKQYFWRTYDGAEVDFVEERQGKLFGYEFKWNKNRTAPKSWLEYKNSEYKVINKDNFIEFLK